ncbi:hypothetical protein RFI_30163, partial [Reticulomyxa filosa]
MKMQLFITTKQGMKVELSIKEFLLHMDKLRIFVTFRLKQNRDYQYSRQSVHQHQEYKQWNAIMEYRVREENSGKQIQRLEEKNNDNVFDEKYSPNRQITLFLNPRAISLWDMKLGKKVKEITDINCIRTTLSPDGRFFAAFSSYDM